jgi:phosphoribosyl 1,2-cyclic phosphodiesterase
MRLQVIGTGSTGNCYVVHADGNKLLLDAGVPIRKIVQALGGLDGVAGCLLTHEHGDHSAAVSELAARGVDVVASEGTLAALHTDGLLRRFKVISALSTTRLGQFTVVAFDTQHDAAEPLGYVVRYEPTGETLLYTTDTFYLRNTFPGINYWIVECNFDEEVAFQQQEAGELNQTLRNRLVRSHMSLRRLKETLAANDLRQTHCIVLVHLSDARSNEERMVTEINQQTGITTVAASTGIDIPLERAPF